VKEETMSRPKVTRAVSPAQQAIPLSDVTITCYRHPHFVGEEGRVPVEISGRQLGQVLAWLLQTRPGVIGKGHEDTDVWESVDVALNLEGLGEVVRGLAEADPGIDIPSMFAFLADVTGDLAARLHATEEGDLTINRATITLPTRKGAAA
jgi:hypothetical protein